MQLDSFDLVASLQALPETDPIEIDGIRFDGYGGGSHTCAQVCIGVLTVQLLQSFCLALTCG